MADRRRDALTTQSHNDVSHREASRWGDYHKASPLTAAAQLLPHADHRYGATALQYDNWQEEAWDFYHNLGEFNYGVEWFSEALSRVRLIVGELVPGGDEPTPVDSGPAVDLIEALAGGTAAQAALMRSFATQLSVVGEGYFVGREVTDAELYGDTVLDAEPDEDGRVWTVQPVNTLRKSQRTIKTLLGRKRRGWELQTDEVTWLPLPKESLVTRVWQRNEHFPWLAMGPARSALPVMREIDMYNRYIMATLISRVALNGMLLIPDEVTLPVNPEYEEETDPFIAELLDIMRATMKNPGSPASAAPLPLRAPAEVIDKFRHLTFATPLDEKIFQSRTEAIKRLAASLNLPMEVILGMGSVNHWCVDPETEILTRDHGWSTYDQLHVGDLVRTINSDTGLSEWQPVQDIATFNVADEPVLRVTSKFHDSLTTLNHRWLVQRGDGQLHWTTSGELTDVDYIMRAAPASDLPTTPKYEDALVEVVAWFITDGTCTKRKGVPNQVRISQSHRVHPEYTTQIRSALTRLFGAQRSELKTIRGSGAPSWTETQYDTGITTFLLNASARDALLSVFSSPLTKIVDNSFIHDLTLSQLKLFVETFALGDGRVTSTGVITSQRDLARLYPVELAAILAGLPVKTYVRESSGFKAGEITTLRVGAADGDTTHRYDRVGLRYATQERTRYSGVVWCPKTPNGTWLARRNGQVFYTGNSSWQLEESAIKIHIAPSVEVITRCLTVGYLYPMLRALGEDVRTKDGSLLVVWYDTSTLTQRPDRSDLAVQLSDRLIISDAAVRRETGFSEDDAPSDDELETLILKKLAVNPATYAAALKELTGLDLAPPPPEMLGLPGEVPGGSPFGSGPSDGESPGTLGNEPEREAPSTNGEPPPEPMTAAARRDDLVRRVRGAATERERISRLATLIAYDQRHKVGR